LHDLRRSTAALSGAATSFADSFAASLAMLAVSFAASLAMLAVSLAAVPSEARAEATMCALARATAAHASWFRTTGRTDSVFAGVEA